MAKKWQRSEKLSLAALIVALVACVGNWISKVEIKHVRSDIDAIRIKAAEIDSLKSKIADVEHLTAQRVSSDIFEGTSTNAGIIDIMKSGHKGGWEIEAEENKLVFKQFEIGKWTNRFSLTTNGFTPIR